MVCIMALRHAMPVCSGVGWFHWCREYPVVVEVEVPSEEFVVAACFLVVAAPVVATLWRWC